MNRFWKYTGIAFLVGGISLTWVGWRAQAALSTASLFAGRQISELLIPTQPNEAVPNSAARRYQLSLNGANLELVYTSTGPMKDGPLAEELARIRKNCSRPLEGEGAPSLVQVPVFFAESESEAQVFCLRPARELSLRGAQDLMDAFESTGDLSRIGRIQGAYLRRGQRGHSLLTVESKGPVVLSKMFPSSGDAPGDDFSELPRPAGKRLLSLSRDGSPALAVYESAAARGAALDEYQQVLQDRGLYVRRPRERANDTLWVSARGEDFVVTSRTASSDADTVKLYVARLP